MQKLRLATLVFQLGTTNIVQGNTKKQKAEQPREERKNTAIYVTSLPLDVTEDEIYDSTLR